MAKPTEWFLRPAKTQISLAQSDQHRCCSLPRQYDISSFYIGNFMTQAIVFSWADRFESYQVENPKDRFSCDEAQMQHANNKEADQHTHLDFLMMWLNCEQKKKKQVAQRAMIAHLKASIPRKVYFFFNNLGQDAQNKYAQGQGSDPVEWLLFRRKLSWGNSKVNGQMWLEFELQDFTPVLLVWWWSDQKQSRYNIVSTFFPI